MKQRTTKKQKILELFNSIEWCQRPTGEWCKSISKNDFESVGLYGDVENSQQHCDILYARKIIQKLGHRVIIGGWFHVWKKD